MIITPETLVSHLLEKINQLDNKMVFCRNLNMSRAKLYRLINGQEWSFNDVVDVCGKFGCYLTINEKEHKGESDDEQRR